MTQRSGITLFEDKRIRVAWDDEEEKYFFSIVDIVQVLTDSADGRKYWNKLKQRLKDEEQTPEVIAKIQELTAERALRVAQIQERYPYPEEPTSNIS